MRALIAFRCLPLFFYSFILMQCIVSVYNLVIRTCTLIRCNYIENIRFIHKSHQDFLNIFCHPKWLLSKLCTPFLCCFVSIIMYLVTLRLQIPVKKVCAKLLKLWWHSIDILIIRLYWEIQNSVRHSSLWNQALWGPIYIIFLIVNTF